MKDMIVGIDLGTTNSEIAIVHDGRVEVIPVRGDQRILPSVVGIDEQGRLLVGEPAANQHLLHPERTIRSVKRAMGSDARFTLGDKTYSAPEVSAIILRHLKEQAEAYLKQTVTKAVITVPAFFSDAQRQATRLAGEIAGLDVVRIINEPTAAALAYETRRQGGSKALVYDLGGGTFDVSVVNLEGDIVEVLASHGNNHLGGDDFDQKIVDFLVEQIRTHHELDVTTSLTAMARLRRAAEHAKIVLSDKPFATIAEEYLLEHQGLPFHLNLELSREDYDEMIRTFITETLEAVHIALKGAGLTVSAIDEILLVGGATRTPLVVQQLEQALGLLPRGEVSPDLCVAMGAAIQAGVIAGAETPSVLVDVTPYTFGTSVMGELDGTVYEFVYAPLIRKNTPIPVAKSEVFTTVYDHQPAIDVRVFQGEDRDALNNIEIGQFTIEGLRKVPAGNPIVMTLSLNVDGILKVTAREKDSGLEQSITIDNAMHAYSDQQLADAQNRVGDLFGEGTASTDVAERRQRVEAKALLEKAQRLLQGAAEQNAEDLVTCIEALQDGLEHDDEAALQAAINEMADLLYYLES